ncbi:GNAT family N-acetyltransferase [Anaerotalea alkaliphila]|uniref:GNAT family N-acetyltransferase n=1 Tax=Anaerotalea alkaliphila TaxID=2662126 RepID=A0A7X5HWU3_9FIRM|nr:GNAT family N-acetyltransferase [Anaerotalea alkaliphila]NDL68082.1 GNAT family N-acetyltransferase [Anaerotalea alkaliphila]
MIQAGYFFNDKEALEDAWAIRRKVFIEEQGVSEELEMDGKDQDNWFVVVYEDDKPLATGRLLNEEGKYLAGRIAVLKEFRGQHLGDLVVKMLVDKAFTLGGEAVYLHAQTDALGFYETIGFEAFGDVYQEAGIPHQSMFITEKMVKKCKH